MLRKKDYKDLNKWKVTSNRQKRRYYAKTQNAENRNQPWTIEEIDMVMEHKITDSELSAVIGRSVGAIQNMRSKQKAEERRIAGKKSK